MREEAYIAIAEDGYVTLFWGNGTEDIKTPIIRGARAKQGQELVQAILELKEWAEDNGYEVVVPAYDLEAPQVEIDVPDEEIEIIDFGDVDDLLDDLYYAGDYDDDAY